MKLSTIIQLALALLKLVNYITRRIDQSQWEASGYKKAMADELVIINASVGLADKAFVEAENLTPAEKRDRLKDDI